ncbi:hypothetical protein DM860_002143 [Cuscuta australis]|uniref:Uncharacterized protein n=1 Tax=Cuscuta australis TaxID=267555 RepID=A0A328DVY6_9ASTE|nr:hypothetical protein DM860_002143 [Cuscuta australis]
MAQLPLQTLPYSLPNKYATRVVGRESKAQWRLASIKERRTCECAKLVMKWDTMIVEICQ